MARRPFVRALYVFAGVEINRVQTTREGLRDVEFHDLIGFDALLSMLIFYIRGIMVKAMLDKPAYPRTPLRSGAVL